MERHEGEGHAQTKKRTAQDIEESQEKESPEEEMLFREFDVEPSEEEPEEEE
ncbi:MAG TPA: hypothetical protein VFI02_12530 [Armatimonadota bacterium]|nr:hypothetical protein [Armatimonadota bacterium]